MTFEPVPLTIAQLSQEHPQYVANSPAWRTIEALRSGYGAIKKNVGKYLPRRPVEDDELYELRKAKLCYSPVMAHVVRTYAGKLVEAGIVFPETTNKVWLDLRGNSAAVGKPKRGELSLLSDIFRSLLYFGKAYTMVDLPKQVTQARSTFELRQNGYKPYFTSISPLEVINWGEGWYVLKQYVQDSTPFTANPLHCLFTYIGLDKTYRYSVPVKLEDVEDCEGNLVPQIAKVLYKNEWQKPDEFMTFDVTEIIAGVGSDRLVMTTVDDDEWLCYALYNKQIQHLRIENAWVDAGYLSGTVQRVFTPSDPTVNDDPRVSYSDDSTRRDLAQAGNTHILIGKGYSFVESSGTALANLEQMLDKIEQQIKVVANLHFASSSKGTLQQSGLSKQMDMSLLTGIMHEYGLVVLDSYNALLAQVARILSIDPVIVHGAGKSTLKWAMPRQRFSG